MVGNSNESAIAEAATEDKKCNGNVVRTGRKLLQMMATEI